MQLKPGNFTKQLWLVMVAAAMCLSVGCKHAPGKKQAINPVIGDLSFTAKFGHKPDASTDENTRISTHLEYVENLLREKDVSALSANLQSRRSNLVTLLHEYRTKGVFPKNYDFAGERKPCFIDRDGNICAVGYLVEQTAGRQTAEAINQQFKYEELLAMNDPAVDKWIAGSGLTKKELAMIQPTYGFPMPTEPIFSNRISTGYGISSSALSGVNLSMNVLNGIQIGKQVKGKFLPVAGLASGAGQVLLGSLMYPKKQFDWTGTEVRNKGQQTLSLVNIGLGTSTMLLSAWNLLSNHHPKERTVAWNVFSFPLPNNNTGVAFSLTKRI